MTNITTRSAVGRPLTYAEMDGNFNNINSGKAEVSVTDGLTQKTNTLSQQVGSVLQGLGALSQKAGSSLIGFFQAGSSSVQRTAQDKMRETMVSATDYGAADDGVTDDSTAEANALNQAVASRNLLRSLWMFKLPKRGLKVWKRTFGSKDQAAAVSITVGDDSSEPVTQVLGFTTDSDVSVYADRDHVALFVQHSGMPALVTSSNTTFTSTSVTSADLTVAIAAGSIKRGMLIDTNETPKKTGVVNGASGSTISVSAWFIVDGSRTTGTPAAGTTIYVNPSTKIWAHNANVLLPANAMATGAVGFELGLVNDKADGVGYLYDAVNLGSKKGGTAHQSRGTWVEGFHAYVGTDYGFIANAANIINFYAAGGPIGFQSDGATAIAFLAKNAQVALAVQKSDGTTLEILDGQGIWSSFRTKYIAYAANTTIDALAVVASSPVVSATTVINLPSPANDNAQRLLYLKNPKGSTASVLYAGLVEDASGSIPVTPGGCISVISDGAKWIPIGKY